MRARRGAIIIAIVLIAVVFLGVLAVSYNGLVANQQAVLAQWAQVENQYQRKIDLIPRLVNLTSQYMQFERSTLLNITALRTQWQNATTIGARVNLSTQLDRQLILLVATYENYPELQSVGLVAGLMDELAGTENRIAVERGRFNDDVRTYNTRLQSFPDALAGRVFGFQPYDYYDPFPGGP